MLLNHASAIIYHEWWTYRTSAWNGILRAKAFGTPPEW